MRSLAILLILIVGLPAAASAFTLSEGDANDAGQVLTVANESVQLRFAGASTSMEDEFIWDASPEGSFYCNEASADETFDVGSFTKATQLDFFLRTPWTPFWSTGPAENNGDGVTHARVTQTGPNTVVIGFEDCGGGGDRDYNDCRVELTITPLE